jgi:AraC-like DNA-binding protein
MSDRALVLADPDYNATDAENKLVVKADTANPPKGNEDAKRQFQFKPLESLPGFAREAQAVQKLLKDRGWRPQLNTGVAASQVGRPRRQDAGLRTDALHLLRRGVCSDGLLPVPVGRLAGHPALQADEFRPRRFAVFVQPVGLILADEPPQRQPRIVALGPLADSLVWKRRALGVTPVSSRRIPAFSVGFFDTPRSSPPLYKVLNGPVQVLIFGWRPDYRSIFTDSAGHLIWHLLAPRRLERGRDGVLPRGRLRAVVEYIEEHFDASLTLEQMAAAAHLSAYHFARQFKAATGLPPHQYVILRRVERARQLLHAGTDLSLAEVALRAGFSDQSQLSHHFKRLVGVTPGQFRTPARIA